MKIKIKTRRDLNRSYGGDFFIALILLIGGIFMALPLIYAVSSSLKPLNEFWIFPPRFWVQNPTLDNFKELGQLISSSWVPFSRYIFNTVFISVVGTVGHVIIASACAYALSKHKFPGSEIIFKMIVLSLMFSSAVTGIPNFMIHTKIGWVDTYAVLIVPAFASSLGLYLMKQFIEQMVPDTILEAARIDGANEWYIFIKIVMPMVKPAWLTLTIFSFFGLWNMGASNLIHSEQLKTLNYALSQLLNAGIARAGVSAAATVIMMIVPIIVFLISQSNIVETMSASGMKE